jgi:hypothetical protein
MPIYNKTINYRFKTREELQKLTKERLLKYYKAERQRMFSCGFRLADGSEDPQYGEPYDGWLNYSLPEEDLIAQVDYMAIMKEILATKGHVDRSKKKTIQTKVKGSR